MNMINEVSKCAEIRCSSFDNLHFHLDDVDTEIWELEATVRKHFLAVYVDTLMSDNCLLEETITMRVLNPVFHTF